MFCGKDVCKMNRSLMLNTVIDVCIEHEKMLLRLVILRSCSLAILLLRIIVAITSHNLNKTLFLMLHHGKTQKTLNLFI